MIENDEQFHLTFEQLGRMYEALLAMRKNILPVNPRKYEVFSEGFVDQICELQAEIDAYLGLQGVKSQAPTEAAQPALRETPPPYREPK
jgi:hypothetical protein